MRKLTYARLVRKRDFKRIMDLFSVKDLPEGFTTIMSKFGGYCINERVFVDTMNDTVRYIDSFLDYTQIMNIQKFIAEVVELKLCPFGNESMGYHFCISLEESDYNSVYIFETNGIIDDKPYRKICNSFEEFTESLITMEEYDKSIET